MSTAKLAIQNGAAGIIVSNHGARQLDHVSATISALEEVTHSLTHSPSVHSCAALKPISRKKNSISTTQKPAECVPSFPSIVCQVVQAAAGRLPVFLDGGVRRGTDVLKALALGASGVFVSNPNPNSTFSSKEFHGMGVGFQS